MLEGSIASLSQEQFDLLSRLVHQSGVKGTDVFSRCSHQEGDGNCASTSSWSLMVVIIGTCRTLVEGAETLENGPDCYFQVRDSGTTRGCDQLQPHQVTVRSLAMGHDSTAPPHLDQSDWGKKHPPRSSEESTSTNDKGHVHRNP